MSADDVRIHEAKFCGTVLRNDLSLNHRTTTDLRRLTQRMGQNQ